MITRVLKQLGQSLPESCLLFAKFSPGNTWVSSVSKSSVYKEEIETGEITQLTIDGTEGNINRTFNWDWSGGGNTTLNLMFRYPEFYQTCIAVTSVTNRPY